MFSLLDVVGRRHKPIKIIDVGAMMIAEREPEYHALLQPGVSEVVGFEPDETECSRLNETYTKACTFLPFFVGDGSQRNFRMCNYNMTSSLYEPNTELLEKFQNLAELHQVVERGSVSTKRLDDLQEVAGADYLKIDVQGGELDVFNGAEKLLSEIMVIHTEVEFVPMYVDQPLFGDIDLALRKAGFLFHTFYNKATAGRCFKPLVDKDNVNRALSQVLWADVIYVKNFMEYDRVSAEKLLKLAIILHDVYGSYDLVHYVLDCYDKQAKSQLASQYLSLLKQEGV